MLNIHKLRNNMNSCNMCENPYPYWCEDCQTCLIEETQIQEIERKYVGSGEDFCPDTYFQSLEGMLT